MFLCLIECYIFDLYFASGATIDVLMSAQCYCYYFYFFEIRHFGFVDCKLLLLGANIDKTSQLVRVPRKMNRTDILFLV